VRRTTQDIDVAIERVLDEPTSDFVELVKVAGLDPAVDLRFGNWAGLDLSGADLRGFDFTGADLTGVRFDNALVAGAIFSGASYDRAALSAAADAPNSQRRAVDRLAAFIAQSVDEARAVEVPFFHLEFDRVFPDEIYAQILALKPESRDYRPMHGRSKGHDLDDGTHTRVKIDLFPEYIRNLPAQTRALWNVVGRALCSEPVKQAFIRRLAPGLSKRFGPDFAKVGMFPIPILTRDIPGYLITPHTDARWKGITAQFYLPEDANNTDIGIIFHEVKPDGSRPKHSQMRFAPNTGYAFAVGTDTWHSADAVHNRVKTRDSILLTYFVDRGMLNELRNRGRRLGNFLIDALQRM
jgi:hypothetical protein